METDTPMNDMKDNWILTLKRDFQLNHPSSHGHTLTRQVRVSFPVPTCKPRLSSAPAPALALIITIPREGSQDSGQVTRVLMSKFVCGQPPCSFLIDRTRFPFCHSGSFTLVFRLDGFVCSKDREPGSLIYSQLQPRQAKPFQPLCEILSVRGKELRGELRRLALAFRQQVKWQLLILLRTYYSYVLYVSANSEPRIRDSFANTKISSYPLLAVSPPHIRYSRSL